MFYKKCKSSSTHQIIEITKSNLVILGVAFGILTILFALTACSGSNETLLSSKPTTTSNTTMKTSSTKSETTLIETYDLNNLPSFSLAELEDVSFGIAKRYVQHVVVHEKVTSADLEKISKYIIEEAKKTKDFNAIAIGFYDYEQYIGFGYTLGKAEYAPEGLWSKANTVNTGDYDTMEYTFNFYEKDWTQQLTPKEVEIWAEFEKILDQGTEEEKAYVSIAAKFKISADEVKDIAERQIIWAFMNT